MAATDDECVGGHASPPACGRGRGWGLVGGPSHPSIPSRLREGKRLQPGAGGLCSRAPGMSARILRQKLPRDRKSVVLGKSVSVRVELGGRVITKQIQHSHIYAHIYLLVIYYHS